MTKAKSKGEKDAVQRQETLNSKIRMDGVGEDPAIQAITSKEFLTANDVEAAKMAAGIAKILRGDLTAEFDERLNKYLELVSKQMEEERKYNEGRIKWLEEKMEKANALRSVSDSDKDRSAAHAAEVAKQAREEAVSESAHELLKFRKRCAEAPKVTVTSYGRPYRSRSGIKYETEVIKYSVGMRTIQFVLPIGQATELPDFIAAEYGRRKQEEMKLDTLKDDLNVSNKIQPFDKIAQKHPEIDPRHGANTMSGNEMLQMAEATKELKT